MLSGPGIWHLHEPFNPNHGLWSSYFSYRRPDERDQKLDDIARGVKDGRLIGGPNGVFLKGIRANRAGMPARLGLYRDCIRRILVKDPIACLLAEYLAVNHGFHVLLVLRHPAGFASSLQILGWDTAARLRKLLGDEALMRDWLHPFEAIMRTCSREPSLQTHTTLYAALWTVLWGFARCRDNIQVVSYERLCAAPEVEFKRLHQALNLPYGPEDQGRHQRLSGARRSGEILSPFDVVRNSESSLGVWVERLSQQEADVVRSAWQAFDVPFFKADADWQQSTSQEPA